MEFTYCHDKFPNTAQIEKATKYNPLIQALRIMEWQVNPLITITTDVRGAIHEQSIQRIRLTQKTPQKEVGTLMKQIHQIAIKYLTYLIFD